MERAAGNQVQLVSVVVQQMNSVAVDMCELIEVCGNEVVDSALKPRFSLVTLLLNCAGFSWCDTASQCVHAVSACWTGFWLSFSLHTLPFSLTLTFSLTHIHSLSPVLVVMMESKELNTKIYSHAHSLVLSLHTVSVLRTLSFSLTAILTAVCYCSCC